MAAELETHQPLPEPPNATVPSTAAVPTTSAQPIAENALRPQPAPKRQRRPSVRLGEIGDRRADKINRESRANRPNMPPWSWRTAPKEASRTSKARSLTNLANGGEEIAEFGNRRGKAKRGPTTKKRLRSNFAPRTTTTADNNEGDEASGDFDHDQDHSPVHSVHDGGYWHIGRHQDRARVSENDVAESDSREGGRKCEGVRSWLFELGLSRYAAMFEIHEVDDELLPMLTLEDLKDMGINAVGSRRKMYTAIQKLRKEFP